MTKDNKSHKNLGSKLLLIATFVLGGMAINHGAKIYNVKEITSTYQGYYVDDEKVYLVFDDKQKGARENPPVLTIEGKPDTLKIGEEYTVKYSIRNWHHMFPNSIMKIKYAKPSK
jgi:hypothetical protein